MPCRFVQDCAERNQNAASVLTHHEHRDVFDMFLTGEGEMAEGDDFQMASKWAAEASGLDIIRSCVSDEDKSVELHGQFQEMFLRVIMTERKRVAAEIASVPLNVVPAHMWRERLANYILTGSFSLPSPTL